MNTAAQLLMRHYTGLCADAGVRMQKSLQEFREGMTLTGTVNAMFFNHGIKVDIGGLYDGCAPLCTPPVLNVPLLGMPHSRRSNVSIPCDTQVDTGIC